MTTLSQSQAAFKTWLRAQPGTDTAEAGDPCLCWLALWFQSQGVFVWGVFPEHYLQRLDDAPGKASQEILLADPNEAGFTDGDRLPLEQWACDFGIEVDRQYQNACKPSPVTRNQALAVLAGLT